MGENNYFIFSENQFSNNGIPKANFSTVVPAHHKQRVNKTFIITHAPSRWFAAGGLPI